MTNIKHSSKSSTWQTPAEIIDRIYGVLESIDLDPASSEKANEIVLAKRIITKEQDALATAWDCENRAIYLNPPGGRVGNKSKTALFWDRLLDHQDKFSHAIFMCFSIEALQVMQAPMMQAPRQGPLEVFPICIPSKRIKFIREDGKSASSPTHANAIIYVPGRENKAYKFIDEFEDLGIILNRGDY